MDNPRTVAAYGLAHQLDPAAFDGTQLNAYAGVLDEVGDYATCEAIQADANMTNQRTRREIRNSKLEIRNLEVRNG